MELDDDLFCFNHTETEARRGESSSCGFPVLLIPFLAVLGDHHPLLGGKGEISLWRLLSSPPRRGRCEGYGKIAINWVPSGGMILFWNFSSVENFGHVTESSNLHFYFPFFPTLIKVFDDRCLIASFIQNLGILVRLGFLDYNFFIIYWIVV